MSIPHTMTTTQFELDGYQVVRSLGIVRGIIVRSRSLFQWLLILAETGKNLLDRKVHEAIINLM
jgi:uncharacterized protein YbjQ (UPF0145 family)